VIGLVILIGWDELPFVLMTGGGRTDTLWLLATFVLPLLPLVAGVMAYRAARKPQRN
jgi:hypothetical protein